MQNVKLDQKQKTPLETTKSQSIAAVNPFFYYVSANVVPQKQTKITDSALTTTKKQVDSASKLNQQSSIQRQNKYKQRQRQLQCKDRNFLGNNSSISNNEVQKKQMINSRLIMSERRSRSRDNDKQFKKQSFLKQSMTKPSQQKSEANSQKNNKQYHYFKTKLCPLFQKSNCPKGSQCHYAHGHKQLRGLPNFMKTRTCIPFKNGHCPKTSSQCKYAHGEKQLRNLDRQGINKQYKNNRNYEKDQTYRYHEGKNQRTYDRNQKYLDRNQRRYQKYTDGIFKNKGYQHYKKNDKNSEERRYKDKQTQKYHRQKDNGYDKNYIKRETSNIEVNNEYKKYLYGNNSENNLQSNYSSYKYNKDNAYMIPNQSQLPSKIPNNYSFNSAYNYPEPLSKQEALLAPTYNSIVPNYYYGQTNNIASNIPYKNSVYPGSKQYLNPLDFSKDIQNNLAIQNSMNSSEFPRDHPPNFLQPFSFYTNANNFNKESLYGQTPNQFFPDDKRSLSFYDVKKDPYIFSDDKRNQFFYDGKLGNQLGNQSYPKYMSETSYQSKSGPKDSGYSSGSNKMSSNANSQNNSNSFYAGIQGNSNFVNGSSRGLNYPSSGSKNISSSNQNYASSKYPFNKY